METESGISRNVAWDFCIDSFVNKKEGRSQAAFDDKAQEKSVLCDLLVALGLSGDEFLTCLFSICKKEEFGLRDHVFILKEFADHLNELQLFDCQVLLFRLLGENVFDLAKDSIEYFANRQCEVQKAIHYRCKDFGLDMFQYDAIERLIWRFMMNTPVPRKQEHLKDFFYKFAPEFGVEASIDLVDDFFNGFRHLLQVGPHQAILNLGHIAVDRDWGLLDELKKYPTNGNYINRCNWGPIRCVEHDGKALAIKVVNLRRLKKHKQRSTNCSFNDDVHNEIAVHRAICKHRGHGRENIIDFITVTKDTSNVYIYLELGIDMFDWVSRNYQTYFSEWNLKCRKEHWNQEVSRSSTSPYEEQMKRWCLGIAEGLCFLKSIGVAHRDVKVQNILLDKGKERLKLIDFGVARFYGSWERHFHTKEIVGTMNYMSPECYYHGNSHRADRNGLINCETEYWKADANDVWSFGVTVFELMFSCPPFVQCSSHDRRFRVLSGDSYYGCDMDREKVGLWTLLESWGKDGMVTRECVNFFEDVFVPQDRRPTIEELVNHPWFATE